MSKKLYEDSNFTDIADAIRVKLGVQDTYKTSEMAAAIATIKGEPVLQEKTATQNGEVTADSGYDGLSKVTVNVGQTLVDCTYDIGATCSLSNGDITISAANVNGRTVFALPLSSNLPETWTAIATDGTNTVNKTITVTQNGQSISLDMTYSLANLFADIPYAKVSETVGDIVDFRGRRAARNTSDPVVVCPFWSGAYGTWAIISRNSEVDMAQASAPSYGYSFYTLEINSGTKTLYVHSLASWDRNAGVAFIHNNNIINLTNEAYLTVDGNNNVIIAGTNASEFESLLNAYYDSVSKRNTIKERLAGTAFARLSDTVGDSAAVGSLSLVRSSGSPEVILTNISDNYYNQKGSFAAISLTSVTDIEGMAQLGSFVIDQYTFYVYCPPKNSWPNDVMPDYYHQTLQGPTYNVGNEGDVHFRFDVGLKSSNSNPANISMAGYSSAEFTRILTDWATEYFAAQNS